MAAQPVRLLGAILAGGASRRFGADKAAALLHGMPLIEHVAAALSAQCAGVIVVGRDWPGIARVDDRPAPGLGPLGGLAGALAYAEAHGYDAVLSSGCDLPALPRDIARRLGAPDAMLVDQPTVGLWRAGNAARLAAHVATDPRRSIRGWAAAIGARAVALDPPLANVNTVDDLDRARLTPPAGPRSSR